MKYGKGDVKVAIEYVIAHRVSSLLETLADDVGEMRGVIELDFPDICDDDSISALDVMLDECLDSAMDAISIAVTENSKIIERTATTISKGIIAEFIVFSLTGVHTK